jgi:hypothetical protein
MLTLPFFASLSTVISFAVNYTKSLDVNDELKASLNDCIDWQNAIYINGPNNEVINKNILILIILTVFIIISDLLCCTKCFIYDHFLCH